MSKGTYQRENLFEVAVVQHTITGTNLAGVVASADDLYLIEQLRGGNEAAFVALIDRYASAMLRLAMVYVKAWAVAEEVVQETWLAVLEGLDRDVPLSAPDLIELWLGTVKTPRDSGRINLAEWFDDDEGIRYCLEDAFISPVMDWREVVRCDCRVDPKMRDKEAACAISLRADRYSNLPIAQGAGSHERLDRRLPNAVLSFHRISQIHNFGFRQNDTAVANFSLTFDDRRITFAERAETREHFIDCIVFALQRAQGDLS